MKAITRKAIVVGIIAGLLVLCDGIISKLLNQTGSFTWVAFVSWTVFFGATIKERLKAIPGYIIGFFAAVAIMKLGGYLSFIQFNIMGVAIGSILATMIINFMCMELENIQKFFPISISGIFVGIAMTFSGLGVGFTINTLNSCIMMISIIVIYGILGLISGWATLKFGTKK
ncbi:MAG: DUF1097 domain-containing protein [Clostridiales bacterium]|nr:DUF1097 domain-containing protein [Clostridiales bacterium]